MPFLVDGSNLGGVVGGASGSRDRHGVLELLLPWARRRRVTVVFDGPAEGAATSYGNLDVRFGEGRPADQLILSLLGRRARDWTVVSDDRGLLAECQARGATVVLARELLPVLLGPAARREPSERAVEGKRVASLREGPVDVADWEEWFRRGGEGGEP
jgi:hypothetical protein